MSERHKNKPIIFLTTLSVYLGLMLVGGTPKISAQISNSRPVSKKASVLAGDSVISINAQWVIELGKIISENSTSAHIFGNIIFPEKGSSEWQIQTEKGDAEAISLLRKQFFSPIEVSPPNLPLPYQKITVEVEANQNEIKFEWHTTFRNLNDAVQFGKSYEYILSHREKLSDKIGKAEVLFLENTKATSENNQVFIVTRLPRGSLDALLKQDAKAEK